MAEPHSAPPLLRCVDLSVQIADVVVTRNLQLSIEAGQCWCILGRNGVGKTTLLHTLAGLRTARSGSIALNGRALAAYKRRSLARQLGILFQNHEDPFPATVLESVLQGRHPHLRAWQWESAEDNAIARQALAQFGLEAFAGRNVQTLSGGERQRVALATLLAQDTQLLLLDEPSNHLDLHQRLEALGRLVSFCRANNKALVMVLHDINLAARFADHALLVLGDGETRHGRQSDILDTGILERLYGHPLVRLDTPGGPAWLPR
ncbi:MAG: ABC transporter ATP-binding protein [Thiogranum sp.]|nr:ABC transporter ATP-binding protein [Thiogranum sp.]